MGSEEIRGVNKEVMRNSIIPALLTSQYHKNYRTYRKKVILDVCVMFSKRQGKY